MVPITILYFNIYDETLNKKIITGYLILETVALWIGITFEK